MCDHIVQHSIFKNSGPVIFKNLSSGQITTYKISQYYGDPFVLLLILILLYLKMSRSFKSWVLEERNKN